MKCKLTRGAKASDGLAAYYTTVNIYKQHGTRIQQNTTINTQNIPFSLNYGVKIYNVINYFTINTEQYKYTNNYPENSPYTFPSFSTRVQFSLLSTECLYTLTGTHQPTILPVRRGTRPLFQDRLAGNTVKEDPLNIVARDPRTLN